MKFLKAPLEGPHIIEPERREDHRGFLARLFCEREFAAAGLEGRFVQINNSTSLRKGIVRGLHYQAPPHSEVKVMRVIRGAIFDVVVDVRLGSPTFGRWFGAELSAGNRLMMYSPRGFAHGFMSLTDDVEVIYLTSSSYAPGSERGVRFDDPGVGVAWPAPPLEVSDKDRSWPDLDPATHGVVIEGGA
ncbi:dTDP-4-dehydrorhamnose 3,5-epimerase [Neoroseomonas soli]|uniref:dTDP-4-dehydrorhamnose 3,5-epimerase n=1 Tax=Neoroseomonas soli TaxID=1081025 RepID=A0A9X9X0T9_9PROT|nr:dTDP-4-dehydrorhamnose 3,5-epimerase [Neoroseomonas soli]MBR0673018.1 dTDP-4-dehydrorhamnose 3,5-epimerase [Neoroseomonas soli]